MELTWERRAFLVEQSAVFCEMFALPNGSPPPALEIVAGSL